MSNKKKVKSFYIGNGICVALLYFALNGSTGAENLFKFVTILMPFLMLFGVILVNIPNDDVQQTFKDSYSPRPVPKWIYHGIGLACAIVCIWHGWFITGTCMLLTEYFQSLYRTKLDEICVDT